MPKSPKPIPPAETESSDFVDSSDFVEIDYKGTTFVIPRNRDDWSTEAMGYLAEEKYNLFIKHTLEIAKPGQWEMVVFLCPRRRDFTEFFQVFIKAAESCEG